MLKTPDFVASELAETAENGNRADVRDMLRELAETNPAFAVAAALRVGEYLHASDPYSLGVVSRLMSDDLEPINA